VKGREVAHLELVQGTAVHEEVELGFVELILYRHFSLDH
jgi:hypothetical protein